jgi:alpha-D-ribose 1-methylphosphonate 5-triphosphate synthase subunit PhnG
MAVLARAPAEAIRAALDALAPPPAWTRLRGPEIGMTMVRGRMGGDGAAFNLGEMTVVRASIRLADGTVGHAFRAGRDREAAELAAVCDALLQDPAHAALQGALIVPQRAAQQQARADIAARAAATRVDFFGMVRMG